MKIKKGAGRSLLGIVGQAAVAGGASYMAGANHDLRTGFGRKEGETLPLYKDYRVLGGVASAIVAATSSGEMSKMAGEAAASLASSVASTEAVRYRAIAAAKAASEAGEQVILNVPA